MSDTYTYTPIQELVGSEQPHHTQALVEGSQAAKRLTPLGQRTKDGVFVAWNPNATDGSQKAVYLAVFTDAITADEPVYREVIKSGHWNTNAIKWPKDTTDTQKRLAFVGTPISHQPI